MGSASCISRTVSGTASTWLAHADVIAGAGPVGGNDGPDFAWHLADFFCDAVEDVAAAFAGSAGELAGDFSGAAEERGDGEAGEAEAGDGDSVAGEALAAIDFALAAGVHGRPFLAAHGIDEDYAGDIFGVAERVAAHDKSAE